MSSLFKYILVAVITFLFFSNAKAQDTVVDSRVMEAIPDDRDSEEPYASPEEQYRFREATPVKVGVRNIPDDELNAVKSEKDYWYVNEAPVREKQKMEQPKKQTNYINEQWVRSLFWILLIVGFVALLIWFLATSDISLFRKKQKTIADDVLEQEEGENIFEMNFEKEIRNAINDENYRLAVRLMYLRTLRDLSDRNLIKYTHEKTNSDYLFQLAASPYYKNFFRLTRSFDYTWYGQFPLSRDGFSTVQNDFNSFKQQLSR